MIRKRKSSVTKYNASHSPVENNIFSIITYLISVGIPSSIAYIIWIEFKKQESKIVDFIGKLSGKAMEEILKSVEPEPENGIYTKIGGEGLRKRVIIRGATFKPGQNDTQHKNPFLDEAMNSKSVAAPGGGKLFGF